MIILFSLSLKGISWTIIPRQPVVDQSGLVDDNGLSDCGATFALPTMSKREMAAVWQRSTVFNLSCGKLVTISTHNSQQKWSVTRANWGQAAALSSSGKGWRRGDSWYIFQTYSVFDSTDGNWRCCIHSNPPGSGRLYPGRLLINFRRVPQMMHVTSSVQHPVATSIAGRKQSPYLSYTLFRTRFWSYRGLKFRLMSLIHRV